MVDVGWEYPTNKTRNYTKLVGWEHPTKNDIEEKDKTMRDGI